MTYLAWRVSFQSSERAAQVAYEEMQRLNAQVDALATQVNTYQCVMSLTGATYDMDLCNKALTEHDTEVAKAAFIAGVEARRIAMLSDAGANIKAEQYANQLRQAAKGVNSLFPRTHLKECKYHGVEPASMCPCNCDVKGGD